MILKATSRIARWGRLLFLPCFGCSRSHLPDRKKRYSLSISIALLMLMNQGYAVPLELKTDSTMSTAGYFQLSWHGDASIFSLQESASADFGSAKTIYKGRDLATVISGKADDDYYYRVSIKDNQKTSYSNIVKVTVAHHPLGTAWLFFTAGAVVFVATLIVIIRGNRQQA